MATSIRVKVHAGAFPIRNAYIRLFFRNGRDQEEERYDFTGSDGMCDFDNVDPERQYIVYFMNVSAPNGGTSYVGIAHELPFPLERGKPNYVDCPVETQIQCHIDYYRAGARSAARPVVGDTAVLQLRTRKTLHAQKAQDWAPGLPDGFHAGAIFPLVDDKADTPQFSTLLRYGGTQVLQVRIELDPLRGDPGVNADGLAAMAGAVVERSVPKAEYIIETSVGADERSPVPISGNVGVSLSRSETEETDDVALWVLIRNSTDALSFLNYDAFLNELFCTHSDKDGKGHELFRSLLGRRALPFTDSDAYRVLKVATEAYVMVNCGVMTPPLPFNQQDDAGWLDRRDLPANANLQSVLAKYLDKGAGMLPYLAVIRRKLPEVGFQMASDRMNDADLCYGLIQERLSNPCMVELIWSYWLEEGMLAQSMNVITRRFQNQRAPGNAPDPLANTEIDILRPLNSLLWGYTQDEQHRLTVQRRNYEYDHHYGIRLEGKAVRDFRPADSRSKFLQAFHHLMRMLTAFYRQDDDTTVKADAFPILNALKEIHLVLSEGAHNQYGDLPSTARIEMLMQQWILARPEFREFLPTRTMVAYPEPWMDRVDAMKKLQGWTDTSIVHFRNLAIFGEQLLLSIRFGDWSSVIEPTQAFNWARFWRPQAQGYLHAYRAATGVDLSAELVNTAVEATLPSVLLRQRLNDQLSKV